MCPALADDNALDFRSADGAGLALTAIHAEMVLEITAAVDPVNAGTVSANSFLQHLPDGHPEDLGFFFGDRI